MRSARVTDGSAFASALVFDDGVRLLEDWRRGDPLAAAFVPPDAIQSKRYASELIPLDAVRFLPPLSASTKVICLGLNYREHVEEVRGDQPTQPALFVKLPDAFVGHQGATSMPRISHQYDYEGEIAVVIGRECRGVKKADAMAYVFGFTILMDGSVRDYQKHSLSAGKCFFRSSALGPWISSLDSIDDFRSLRLETRLNGETVQSTSAECMIHDVPSAIEYISQWTPLHPGDIVSTGTCAGIGMAQQPPRWLKPGDVVDVAVSSVGNLRCRVADEREE